MALQPPMPGSMNTIRFQEALRAPFVLGFWRPDKADFLWGNAGTPTANREVPQSRNGLAARIGGWTKPIEKQASAGSLMAQGPGIQRPQKDPSRCLCSMHRPPIISG